MPYTFRKRKSGNRLNRQNKSHHAERKTYSMQIAGKPNRTGGHWENVKSWTVIFHRAAHANTLLHIFTRFYIYFHTLLCAFMWLYMLFCSKVWFFLGAPGFSVSIIQSFFGVSCVLLSVLRGLVFSYLIWPEINHSETIGSWKWIALI